MSVSNIDQAGSNNWLDRQITDDRVFIRFQSSQLFRAELTLLHFLFAHGLGFRVGLCSRHWVIAREYSFQGSEDAALRLASKKCRILLKIQTHNYLARQRGVFEQ